MSELAVPRVLVHPEAESLAFAAAARLITALIDAQSVETPLHVVLTGGTIGIKTLEAVSDSPAASAVDWSAVHFWWGDERFLPAGDPDRNDTQARDALLDKLAGRLPQENVHTVPAPGEPGGDTPETAAAAYAAELAAHAAPGAAVPSFLVLLLGMGPDGHVASLFPGLPGVETSGQSVVGVEGSPKPPPERVSLTLDAIQQARAVWVIAAGAEKAPAVAAAFAPGPARDLPARGARGQQQSLWLVDLSASGDLPAV